MKSVMLDAISSRIKTSDLSVAQSLPHFDDAAARRPNVAGIISCGAKGVSGAHSHQSKWLVECRSLVHIPRDSSMG